jgi:hypothetical protein
VYFVHDEEESHLFARTFAECLCRCLLRSFAAWDREPDDAVVGTAELWAAHRSILRPFLDDAQNAALDALGADPDPTACRRADERIAQAVGERKLIGCQPPTKFSPKITDERILRRAYDGSVAFYRDLVENEGLESFRAKLDEVLAAREAALAPKPAKKKAAKKKLAKKKPAKKAPKKAPKKKVKKAAPAPKKRKPAKKAKPRVSRRAARGPGGRSRRAPR